MRHAAWRKQQPTQTSHERLRCSDGYECLRLRLHGVRLNLKKMRCSYTAVKLQKAYGNVLRNGEHRQFLPSNRGSAKPMVWICVAVNGEQREVLFELRQPETGSGRKMGSRTWDRDYRQVLFEPENQDSKRKQITIQYNSGSGEEENMRLLYKCPNCGGSTSRSWWRSGGRYRPSSCHRRSRKGEPESSGSAETGRMMPVHRKYPMHRRKAVRRKQSRLVLFLHLPNCSAEIVIDATTAATYCFLPLINLAKLHWPRIEDSGADFVLPFKIRRCGNREIFTICAEATLYSEGLFREKPGM